MKRIIFITVVISFMIMSSLLTSCGAGEKPRLPKSEDYYGPQLSNTTITADGMDIGGDLGDYFRIKNKEVTFEFDTDDRTSNKAPLKQIWTGSLRVERGDKDFEYDMDYDQTEVVMTIFDASGQQITGLNPMVCNGVDILDALEILPGEDYWFLFRGELGEQGEEDVIKNWSKFKVDSKVTYRPDVMDAVEDSQVEAYENEEVESFTSYYVDDSDGWVNLRDRPNGEIIKRVDNYEVGVKVGEEGDWILLRFEDGTEGFIHNTRLKEAP